MSQIDWDIIILVYGLNNLGWDMRDMIHKRTHKETWYTGICFRRHVPQAHIQGDLIQKHIHGDMMHLYIKRQDTTAHTEIWCTYILTRRHNSCLIYIHRDIIHMPTHRDLIHRHPCKETWYTSKHSTQAQTLGDKIHRHKHKETWYRRTLTAMIQRHRQIWYAET